MAKTRTPAIHEALYQALNPRVLRAGLHEATPGWHVRTGQRALTDFDVWYVAQGAGRVMIDRRWLDYRKGDVVLIKPGQRFEEEQADATDPFHNYFVHFLPFAGGAPAGLDAALASLWPKRLPMGHRPRLADLFAQIFDAYLLPPGAGLLRMKVLMMEVLEIILAELRHRRAPRLPPAYPRLQRACEFLRQHYREPLTLDAIADHADLSVSYLLTLFHRHVGCSPIQYQIRQRMRAARPLLARGLSVTAVAREVGFQSLHYFSRTFRAQTGITPGTFAEQCRRK